MKQRKGKKNWHFSTLLSLILAVTMLVGGLPLTELQVKATEDRGTAKQSETNQRTASSEFKHPGLLHSGEDLAQAWQNVQENVSPNKETWDALWGDTFSNPNWNPRPVEEVTRGVSGANIGQFCVDIKRAYQNALVWKLSGDEAHGATACRILNAWSSTMKRLGGSQDRFLAAGLQGYQLANIGELMRDYPGFDLEGLQNLLINVFYPMNQDFMIRHNDTYVGSYWANWELCNLASMISIGVFCDRRDIYDQALNFFKHGKGNGSFYHAMPYVLDQNGEEFVQWQESVRDQGHTTLGILLAGVICETAWNQGDDLYGLSDNRFLKAVEYAVKYNSLNEDVPSTWYMRVGGNLKSRPTYEFFAGISAWPRGNWRPIYYQMQNHYVNRKGINMPCVDKMMQNAQGTYIEGSPGNVTDQLGWYSLTYANTSKRVEDKPIQGELTDGVYRIVSALSGKSVVVNTEGILVSAEKGSRDDEWWLIKNNGDGEYTIKNMSTGKVAQINGDGTETREVNGESHTYNRYYLEGPAVGTGEADGSRKQHFAFLKDDNGLFRIVPSMTYYVWGLEANSTEDNTNIIQWFNEANGAYNNGSSMGQRWTFEKATEIGTEFTFDDKSSGFRTTYANAEGDCTLTKHGEGNAVSLNGSSEFLTVEAKTGKSVLTGETAFTVTCEVKPENGSDNWIFYTAPKGTQAAGKETYLGIKEANGIITAEAYKDGKKSASASAAGKNDWCQVSVVFNGAEIVLYINGQEQARETGNCKVTDIIAEDSVTQIGKANFGSGKFYKGLIDNLKITGHAMTVGEVIQAAGDYAVAEIKVPETLVDFTFDNTETGLAGGEAVAKGVYSLQDHDGGKALYLNGYKDYLKVTGKNGGSVVPGGLVKEMTISLQAKRDGGDFGWVFYAAPNDSSPTVDWEKYLGVLDNNGTVTAQRFYNQGQRLPSAEGEAQADRWHYLTIVYTENNIIVYDNGEKIAEAENNVSLSDILGSDSVWYIGKANWVKGINGEKGEHFRGWIDNYKVVSHAWTAEEVKTEALKYVDKSILQAAVDNQTAADQSQYIKGRWETYQAALKTAQDTLADKQALQSAVDLASDALEDVQAWMRLDEALYVSVAADKESEYTEKSWQPYREALKKAKNLRAAGMAERAEVLEAAETLQKTQKELIKKGNTITEAITRIDAIGQVELTPECSRKVILARQICDRLNEEELAQVTNLSYLTEAEAAMENYLAEFTFDDEETGFIGGQAVAAGQGTHNIQNGALYLDGTSSNWLNITKADGSSLLTGREELTISFAEKPESEGSNWMFYAAPNSDAQNLNNENYLGLLEYQGTFTAERYKNNGTRPDSASAVNIDTSDWLYITIVHTATQTKLYVNGEKKAEQESSIALQDILGESSILQIGKANWGNGEYYKGLIDNVKIMGTAMTEAEIKQEAAEHLDSIVEPEKVQSTIEKINAIGTVEATVASREKIEQAREAYDKLSSAEKALVTNVETLFLAELEYEDLLEEAKNVLAQFTFDDVESGFKSSGAVAQPNNEPVIVADQTRGNVLSLDGSANVWLNLTKEDGKPLLTGVEELTVSYYSKADRTDTNWVFYAAPNGNAQTLGTERYLGIMESSGKVTAERFLNGRQDSAEANYNAGWNHVVVVYGADDVKIYINGIHASTAKNNGALKQILGEGSVAQIGKANWGDGEYYQGLLDDYKIYNYAFSEREVQILCGIIADPKQLKEKIREARAIQKENYTDKSFAALQKAIEQAKKAFDTVTTEAEIEEAIAALQAAIEALEQKALDDTALRNKIIEAKEIEQGNYTDESYAALQEAIAAAEKALETVSSPSEVSEAVDALQRAIDALTENGSGDPEDPNQPGTLDRTPLLDKIAEAKEIEQGNYTDESFAALQEAIAKAQEALDSVTTQEEVEEAVSALQQAMDALTDKNHGSSGKVLVKELKLNASQKTLNIGQKFTINVTISPENAFNQNLEFSSNNSKVATVSEDGKVTAKAMGTAEIKVAATDGSKVEAILKVKVRQKMVTSIKAAQQKTSRYVKVTFGKIKGAKQYIIYRSTKAKKGYKKIGTSKKNSFVDKKVKNAKTYYYKVKVKGTTTSYNSALSKKYAKIKVLARPAVKVKASKGGKLTVSWKKIKASKGYVVYTSTKKETGFRAVKTLKKQKLVKTTIKAKKNVKKLYVKVRPYYTEKGKKVFGPYSNTMLVKVKK